MTAFDWLCLALAVADNKVRLARKPNGEWTAEKLQGE